MDLADIKIIKPKQNLSRNERKALNELKQNKEINLKKAEKGNTTVVMNTIHKIQEGQIQLNDQNNYRPLDNPMVKETHSKVSRLIALFTVTFSHLHDNVFERGCEAISGKKRKIARNCLTFTFKYIVMQMRKGNCEKGYYRPSLW